MAIIEVEDRKEQREKSIERGNGASIKGNASGSSMDAAVFIKLPVPKRLDLIKSLMDDISKEKRPKQDAIDFLDALQEAIYSKAHSGANPKGGLAKNIKSLEAVEAARTYMNDRSPSIKMLLEYVAMSI